MGASLLPPTQYSLLWLIVMLGIVVWVVAMFVFGLVFTRSGSNKRVIVFPPRTPDPMMQLVQLKETYLTRVGWLRKQFDDGVVDSVAAYQSLSILLRNFSHEYSMTEANTMTLEEMRNSKRSVGLVGSVEGLYSHIFDKNGGSSGSVSVADVHKVFDNCEAMVKKWG